MRHHPSCWNKVLAKLGFQRVLQRHPRQAAWRGRLSRIEPLEARQMMTVTVDTLADVVDAGDGVTSLREAVASATPADHDVAFHPSLHGGRIALTGSLSLAQSINILGPGADKLTIDASAADSTPLAYDFNGIRAFSVGAAATVTLQGLTITGGDVAGAGGGVSVSGDLKLKSVNIVGNAASTNGGGVYVDGTGKLTIEDSTIDGNYAGAGGGGVGGTFKAGLSLDVKRSTFSNNRAFAGGGGGLLFFSVGTTTNLSVENSTFSGNSADSAGAIQLQSLAGTTINASILHSTVVNNTATVLSGGGLANINSATVTLHNSIIAANTAVNATYHDVLGSVAGAGASSHNIIGQVGNSGLIHDDAKKNKVGSQTNRIDPLLSPLDFHGGTTKSHVPLPGSPAVDAGGPTSGATPAVDQRGYRRVTGRIETNVVSDLDIGASELSKPLNTTVGVTADFDGDGRDDQLTFDPVTREFNVLLGAAVAGRFDVASWGSIWSDASITTGGEPWLVAGDFNGDGRDDALIQTAAAFHVGISDGSIFNFHTVQSLPGAWLDIQVGDVDGDGDEELVGWNASANAWQVARFNEFSGYFSIDANWGAYALLHEAGARYFIADANGDGRDDLIRRTNAGAWGVALSQENQFVSQPSWSTTWFNGYYDFAKNALEVDGPLKKILDTFAEVYNNVELELYPGLMKGPEATRQTKAGNNWDQAALLEEELQALGLGDVKIASGRVRANVDRLREWLGLKASVTNSTLLEVLKASIDYSAAQFDSSTIEFTHAWVQALLPTTAGMAWINFDPSWKFKDRQAGVQIPDELDNIHIPQATGMFDEFSYLGLNSTTDRRLPLEFFEDQVMDWLAKTPAVQGNSLADVPYDGPIKAKHLQSLPIGPGDGFAFPEQPQVAQYENFAAIATTPALSAELTHRVTIRLKKNNEAAVHWTHDLVVPSHSLDTIQVTFGGGSGTAVMTDPDNIATAGPFFSRLVVDGSVVKWASASESFSATDVVKIELVHLAPTKLTKVLVSGDPGYIAPGSPNYVGPTIYDRLVPFTESPGNILAFGLDANQYSRDSLTELQADVLAAVAGDTMQADLVEDVDLLSSYAIAKYWHDYEEQNRTIAGITGAIGYQQWVGSGRISSKPSLLLDPSGAAGDYVIDYLAFGMAPVNFGIDLPNSNNGVFEAASGDFHSEAWQLMGYNSSALEHAIVEEITSADGVSTIKGLQRAFQKNLGISIPGDSTPEVTDDVISVFESRPAAGDSREVYHLYNVRAGSSDIQVINGTVGQLLDASAFTNLLPSHNHNSSTQIDDKLWAFLSNQQVNNVRPLDGVTDVVRVLATKHRTKVDSWTGSVYLTEVPRKSMTFAIQPDGGTPLNGGYSGDVTKAPPPELPLGTFANASWTGDPVHVANGNMFRDETDIVFPNIGVPLTFSRHYDSQSKDDVGMGVGWTYSFSDMLYLDEKGTIGSTGDDEIVWIAASGARHRFKKLANGNYTTPAELKGTLVRQATTEFVAAGGFKYVYLDPSGMEYHFQEINDVHPQNGFDGPHTSIGRLRLQKDEQGNGVRIDYIYPTQFHGFTEIRDLHDVARKLVFTYETGRITTVVKYDPLDNPTNNPSYVPPKWTYGYTDVNGVVHSEKRLSSATSPAVPWLNASYQESTSSTTVTYDYYNAAVGDPPYAKGLIKKIIERDGSWHTYEYYRNGRTFRVKQGEAGQSANAADVQTFNYNLLRNLTEFADERGNVETYIHQTNGLLKKQIHADRSHVKSTWGAVGTPEEFLMASTTDERGAVETFAYYNAADFKKGQLKTSTEKSYIPSTAIVTAYDYLQPANRPHVAALSTVIVDPGDHLAGYKNIKTSNDYDPEGRLTSTTRADGHDAAGAVLAGYATIRTYYVAADGGPAYRLGLLKSIKQPAIVDASGNPIQYETLFDYDAAGNVTKTTTQTAVTAPAVPVVISESTFAYDSLGNVVQKIVAANVIAERVVTESVYDALGRLRETGFADANAVIDPIDGFTSRFKYDKSGRVREATDPLGRITRFEYDRQGNVVKQINPDGTSLLHEYDAFGNCIAKTDALGRTTRIVYDSRNRLIQTIRPDGALESVRYDGLGNVVAKIDALGAVTTFKYDAAGRLLETKLPDPNSPTGTAGPTTTNKYDKLGNLIETIDPEFNVTQFKYDKLQRVVESRTIDGREFASKTLAEKTGIRDSGTSYVPTLGHNPVTLTTTDYDAVGNVKQTATYDVTAIASIPADPRNLITAQNIAANKVQVVAMRYDAFGRPVKTINADNTATSTTYDAAGRVRFQYDELNRVTEFVYDAFGRLEKTKLPDPTTGAITTASPTTTYRYDAVGNRTSVTDPRGFTTRFEYDAFNRVAATVDAQGNRTRSVYDVAGQLVATVDALDRASYTRYDELGRAIEQRSADPDGPGSGVASVSRYRYDAAGRIIEKIDPLGYSTWYEYDRLGRLMTERFTVSQQTLDAGDAGFTIHAGSSASTNQASDYGGDSLLVSPVSGVNPEMTWRFDGLTPGTYRVLASWSAHSSATPYLIYRISDYYNPQNPASGNYFPEDFIDGGANQRTVSSGVKQLDDGAWRGWQELFADFTMHSAGPGSLGIRFSANNLPIHADAVRIERIESRSFTYDANGNRLSETDPLNRVTAYQYDELDRLVVETLPDPDGPLPAGTLLSPRTTTTYDGYGNVTSVLERRGNGLNQRTTDYNYDRRNHRTEEILDAGVDVVNQDNIVTTDYLNLTTQFVYDAVGNLTEKLEMPRDAGYRVLDAGDAGFTIQSGVPGPANQSSDYDGDSLLVAPPAGGNPVMYWRFDNLEPGAYRVLASWSGQPAATTNLIYRISDYYDEASTASGSFFPLDSHDVDATGGGSQRLPAGELRRFENGVWTNWKELSSGFVVHPDGPGSLGVQFVAINQSVHADAIRIERIERRTSYEYDDLNRLVKQTDNATAVAAAERRVTVTHYDAAGNVAKVEQNPGVDPRQIAALYAYDALGRVTSQTEQGLVDGSTQKRTTRYQYDAVGNQTAVIDPMLRMSRSEYDRLDRLVKSIDADPDGSGLLASHVTLFAYDAAGQLIVKNNGGNLTVGAHELDLYAYDPQGRLIRSQNGVGDVTRRSYDAAGNLAKLTDPAGNATTYVYDGLDRLLTETTAAGTPSAAPRQFFYDVNGNIQYSVDRNGRAILFTYDRLDRYASERWYADLNLAKTDVAKWTIAMDKTYDDLGRVVREQSTQKEVAGGAIVHRATDSYRYDGLDRVIEYSNQNLLIPAGPHSSGPALKQTFAYAYDSSGLTKTREQFIDGQFAANTKSTYNAFGELAKLLDWKGGTNGPSSILDFNGLDAVFSYLGDGSLSQIERYTDYLSPPGFRNRTQTSLAYDGAGRLKTISHAQSSRTTATWLANTPILAFAYGYDLAGRINSQSTDWNTTLAGLTTRTDETQSFTFDAAGQLTQVNSNLSGPVAGYSYGANGNRTLAVEPVGGSDLYQTGSDNRVSQDSTYIYQYDLEGNLVSLTSKTDANDYELYDWDHRNRLTKVRQYVDAVLSETVVYRYGADDDLIYRSLLPAGQAAQVEYYLVENGERTIAYEADGDVKRRYGYGPTGEVLFDQVFDATGNPALQSEQDLLLPLGDHQHSTRVVLAHDANDATYVRQSLDYAQFGRVTATLGANGLADSTGVVTLFTHHGSLLDAATGLQQKGERWYSPDLGRFLSEDPIQDGSNWYAFAGNDPVNSADPSGLSQQGHPLNGAYSGNATKAPTIKSGFLPGYNLVDTATAIYQGAKAIAPYVTSALNSPTAARMGNVANLVTTFNSRNSILPAGDPNLPRLFSIATAPNHYVSGGSRGDLFEALQFAQASAYQDARRFNILKQFSDEGRVSHPNLGPPTASIDREADVLNHEFNSRGLGRVALERLNSNGMSFQGTKSISGLYQLKSDVLYPTYSPTGGLGYAPSPADFVTGSLAVGLHSGIRAGVGAFVQDVAMEASGLPFLPSVRTSLGHGRKTAMTASVEFQPYSNREAFTTPGQAHHLNQTEIFGGVVKYDDGVTTPLVGRAFTDPGTPHFTTHRGMEAFFDQYRLGTSRGAKYPIPDGPLLGSRPSFSQVNRAQYNSLQAEGMSPRNALRMIIEAKKEQLGGGFRGSDTIIRLPSRLGQAGGP